MANFLLLFSYTAVSVNAMANLNEKVYDEQELMPMRSLPCFSTLDDGLNKYLGKYNWSYIDGKPVANNSWEITVNSNKTCTITGDDVNITFRFQ